MSETSPQKQGTAPVAANTQRQWEWFWRIIAGLIVITICWVAWVMYQIMPRSVVTQLAYESQIRPIRTQQPASGTSEVAATQPAPAPVAQPASEADLALDQAQAAMRAGAHQASADVQAAALAKGEETGRGEKLKLSTEITTPFAERRSSPPKILEGHPSAPAAADAAGKAR